MKAKVSNGKSLYCRGQNDRTCVLRSIQNVEKVESFIVIALLLEGLTVFL